MKTDKKIIAGCVAIAFSLFCHAEKTLTINGSLAERSDVTEITFAGDNLQLKYESGEVFKIDMEAVEINFSDGTSLKKSFANTFTCNSLIQDQINLSGIEPGATIQIFRMDGQLLYHSVAEDTKATIYVAELAPAPYLLKVGGQIVKFIKK